ncbi:MAG: DUF3343 domain-containing protein [Oscillospiraceae bacterium]|nr:DUF3343 domain-containing protein [Oscillospiraceae bacterium]
MRYYLLAMSSLTLATQAQRLLTGASIPASVVKTPSYLSPRGCSNSVRINALMLLRAKNLLEKKGIKYLKLFASSDGVHYKEV